MPRPDPAWTVHIRQICYATAIFRRKDGRSRGLQEGFVGCGGKDIGSGRLGRQQFCASW